MTPRITFAVALAATLASGAAALAQQPPQAIPRQPVQPPADIVRNAVSQLSPQAVPQPVRPPLPPLQLPLPPQPGTPSAEASTNLMVEVTISRYREDELVSSLPYVLAVASSSTDDFLSGRFTSSLRMGAEVPVLTSLQPASPDGAPGPGAHGGPFTYRWVGTQIECFASGVGDDRYQVTVIVEESSVYGDDATAMETIRAPGAPVFRSFESSNTLVLRDGQSRRYTAAADRVTGESIRMDVTLTVLD